MSYKQLGETCPDVIKINNKIEHLKDKKVTPKIIKNKIEKVTPKITKDRNNYIKYIIFLTPSQIKSFGKRYIIPLNYKNLNNKKGFTVFLTNTQINKLEKSMANRKKVELKFSEKQFKWTNDYIKTENIKKKLENLKFENKKKIDKIKAF